MPEEVNRLLTDAVSDYLFVTEKSGEENLLREGIPPERIFFVGNVMIDTLLRYRDRISESTILSRLGLERCEYTVLTLHRPENVDVRETFTDLLAALDEVSRRTRIVYPVHPRAKRRIDQFALEKEFPSFFGGERLLLVEPLSYLDFLKLVSESSLVLTDSGGVQEETTALSTPCLTLRESTERPVTVTEGTNRIVGTTPQKVIEESLHVLDGHQKVGRMPKLWDGKAAERIVRIILENRKRAVGESHGRAFLLHQ
jgi:UDP-N-acetylglucosamine 2-epimerase (non-hydrolysing)